MLGFCYTGLHAQLLSKCVHSENKRSSADINYITEPIGVQPVYVVETYCEWRRREEVITTKVRRDERTIMWLKNRHLHTQVHIHTLYSRVQPPLCYPDRPSCVCVSRAHLQWPHQPLTWSLCGRRAAHNSCCTSTWAYIHRLAYGLYCTSISGAYNRRRNTLYYSLYLTKPSALGQHLFATHTHALCPLFSHTHAHTTADAHGYGAQKNKTDMLLRINSPWPVQRILGSQCSILNCIVPLTLNLYTHFNFIQSVHCFYTAIISKSKGITSCPCIFCNKMSQKACGKRLLQL